MSHRIVCGSRDAVATIAIFPIVIRLGYDPIRFGVIVTMLAAIKRVCPPGGTTMHVLKDMRQRGARSRTSPAG